MHYLMQHDEIFLSVIYSSITKTVGLAIEKLGFSSGQEQLAGRKFLGLRSILLMIGFNRNAVVEVLSLVKIIKTYSV